MLVHGQALGVSEPEEEALHLLLGSEYFTGRWRELGKDTRSGRWAIVRLPCTTRIGVAINTITCQAAPRPALLLRSPPGVLVGPAQRLFCWRWCAPLARSTGPQVLRLITASI